MPDHNTPDTQYRAQVQGVNGWVDGSLFTSRERATAESFRLARQYGLLTRVIRVDSAPIRDLPGELIGRPSGSIDRKPITSDQNTDYAVSADRVGNDSKKAREVAVWLLRYAEALETGEPCPAQIDSSGS